MRRDRFIGLIIAGTLTACAIAEGFGGLWILTEKRNLNATGTVAAAVLGTCDLEKHGLEVKVATLQAALNERKDATSVVIVQTKVVEKIVKETVVQTAELKPCEPATATATSTRTRTSTRPFITFTPSSTRKNTLTPLPPTVTSGVTVTRRPNTEVPPTQRPPENTPNPTNPPATDRPTNVPTQPDRPTTAPQTAIPTLTR